MSNADIFVGFDEYTTPAAAELRQWPFSANVAETLDPGGYMKTIACAAFAALVTFVAPQTAQSQPSSTAVHLARMTLGYTYFNKAGGDKAVHDAALTGCIQDALKVRTFDDTIGNNGGLIPALIDRAVRNGVVAASTENCMVVRGWRVVLLPEAEGQALSELPRAELSSKIEAWVGAEAPHGQVVRVWNNDAANAANPRFDIRPPKTSKGSLSVGSLAVVPTAAAEVLLGAVQLDPIWPKKPLKPEEVSSAPSQGAVIIFAVKGSMRDGLVMGFARQGDDINSLPSRDDKAPDIAWVARGTFGAKPQARLFAMALPAGRWRISSIGFMPTLNLCLGSPSFEVSAGEVVYAGTFDLSAAKLAPDLDLAAPKAFLAGQPGAEKVRAAAYSNGSRGPCGDNMIYALELEGAPFLEGYNAGSRAK